MTDKLIVLTSDSLFITESPQVLQELQHEPKINEEICILKTKKSKDQ